MTSLSELPLRNRLARLLRRLSETSCKTSPSSDDTPNWHSNLSRHARQSCCHSLLSPPDLCSTPAKPSFMNWLLLLPISWQDGVGGIGHPTMPSCFPVSPQWAECHYAIDLFGAIPPLYLQLWKYEHLHHVYLQFPHFGFNLFNALTIQRNLCRSTSLFSMFNIVCNYSYKIFTQPLRDGPRKVCFTSLLCYSEAVWFMLLVTWYITCEYMLGQWIKHAVDKSFNKQSPLVSIHMVGTGFHMFWLTNSHLQKLWNFFISAKVWGVARGF